MKRLYSVALLAAVLAFGQMSYANAITLGDPEVSDWPEPFDPEPTPEEPVDPVDPVDPTDPVDPAPVAPVVPNFEFGKGDAEQAPYVAQHWTGTCERRADGKIYVHTAFGRNQEIAHAQCKAKVLSEEAEG